MSLPPMLLQRLKSRGLVNAKNGKLNIMFTIRIPQALHYHRTLGQTHYFIR